MGKIDQLRAKLFMLYPLAEFQEKSKVKDINLVNEQIKDIKEFLKENNFTEMELQCLKAFANFI
jgi:hypothetical protein